MAVSASVLPGDHDSASCLAGAPFPCGGPRSCSQPSLFLENTEAEQVGPSPSRPPTPCPLTVRQGPTPCPLPPAATRALGRARGFYPTASVPFPSQAFCREQGPHTTTSQTTEAGSGPIPLTYGLSVPTVTPEKTGPPTPLLSQQLALCACSLTPLKQSLPSCRAA